MAMFGKRKPTPEAVGHQAAAEWSVRTFHVTARAIATRRGKVRGICDVAVDENTASFAAQEIEALLRREHLVIESLTEDPLLYLCWPGAAGAGSPASAALRHEDPQALVLLREDDDSSIVDTLSPEEVAEFSKWFKGVQT